MLRKIIVHALRISILALAGLHSSAHALSVPIFSHSLNISNNISGPTRVATDTSGNIYVADSHSKKVTVVDPLGNKLFLIGGNDVPRSIAVDLQKRIFVGYMNDGQPGYVAIYNSSGQLQRLLGSGVGEFSNPSDIAISFSTGRIYVVDSIQNGVKIYESNGDNALNGGGNPLYFGGHGQYNGWSALDNPGKFDYPSGIAIDDIRQEILVSDQNNYRVQIFDMNGAFKTAFGQHAPDTSWAFGDPVYDLRGKFSSIRGLTVDKEGRIYVADAFQSMIQVLDRTGAFLAFIGEYGNGSTKLNVPIDVTIDNSKRLVITDWNHNRLSLFQLDSGPAIYNLPPETPAQVSPSDATQVGSLTPALTAHNATDPNGDMLVYHFQIDTSPSFNSASLQSFIAAEGSTYTTASSPGLTDHTSYFWRVRAEESASSELLTSAWSGSRTFYVNALNRAPSIPASLTPAANAAVKKTDYLSWGASADPDLYDTLTYVVEISTQPNFSSILLSQAGLGNNSVRIDTINQYTQLNSGVTYYWRVRAIDNHGASSAYSASSSFVFKRTSLKVSSDPAGALIYLDGNYEYLGNYKGLTGSEPVELVDILPGRHVVRLEKAGNFGYYTSVLITDGATETVDASMVENVAGTRPFKTTITDDLGAVVGDGTPAITGARPFLADWNNDGKKELLVGDDTGRVYLYDNITTDAAPMFRISTDYPQGVVLSAGAKASPFVVDWDNDGKKDLLIGGGDGTIRVYLNQGSDESPQFAGYANLAANGSAIQVSGNAAPFVVDWNNDLKKDILVGENSGKVRLFLNTGTNDIPEFNDAGDVTQGAYLQAGSVDIAVAGDAVPYVYDWNQDGKKDMVVGYASGIQVVLNVSTDAAPVFSVAGTPYLLGTGVAPLVVDYNNDGFSDILAGDVDGHISYYQFRKTEAPGPPALAKKKKEKRGLGGSVNKVFKKLKFW